MEERRAAKAFKKGGKRAKALTAEEEARRREALKEKLREKVELERRALKVVERLLEDSVTEDFLIDCARLITAANYKDVIEERTIAKLCGYPICANELGQVPTQKYKICTRTNKVYDITDRKCFCSNFCYKASIDFELQISNTPLWLRQHETPREIRLMKKGNGGSSGEEVILSERRLQEKDIEDPVATQTEDLSGSHQHSVGANVSHSDSSDMEEEQEQDFVSSVVSQRQGPRVHWGDLPSYKNKEEVKRGRAQWQKTQISEGDKEGEGLESRGRERERNLRDDENRKESHSWKAGLKVETQNQHLSSNTEKVNGEKVSEEELTVEETTSKLNLCTLSDAAPRLVDAPSIRADGPACVESKPPTESKLLSSSHIDTNQDSHVAALTNPNITQVGMSKRGAAALQDLLKAHTAAAKPETIRLKLLEGLQRTFKDWCTEATLEFLYGTSCSAGSPSPKVVEEKEEELDEDDLVDETTDEDGQGATTKVPDYERLQEEVQQLEQRVRGFYKGAWCPPERVEDTPGERQATVQDRSTKDPVLPLVDSQAQHLIQKRITVEKLNRCDAASPAEYSIKEETGYDTLIENLKNIVGPLRLTMSNISTDLNNLVRTFKFTNTSIIHKTPEWTLIAVVLLHLLSEVSPVVREALAMPASEEYLATLTAELGLQEQDLADLVGGFKTPAHA